MDKCGQTPCTCGLPGDGLQTDTYYTSEDGELGGHYYEVIADAGVTAFSGSPDTIGPGCPHSATDGSDMPVAQERSAATELETLLLNWLPVGTVTEEDATSPDPPTDSTEGCFSCGDLTHITDQCRTLDEF